MLVALSGSFSCVARTYAFPLTVAVPSRNASVVSLRYETAMAMPIEPFVDWVDSA
jgi:hypothetical protein